MRGSGLLDAMEYVAPELIEEAEKYEKPKIRLSLLRWGGVAACLALVLSLALFLRPAGAALTAFGKELTAEPIMIAEAIGPAARYVAPQGATLLSIPLSLDTARETELSVSDGILQAFDSESEVLLGEGGSVFARTNVKVIWLIEAADKSAQFTVNVDSKYKAVVRYDDTVGGWTIHKENK